MHAGYLVRRVISRFFTIWLVTLLTFVVVSEAPGNPILKYVQHARYSEEKTRQLEQLYGLDKPILERYSIWSLNLLKGDLGESLFTKEPVAKMIGDRIGNTFLLMFTAIIIVILMSIGLGIYAATHQHGIIDQLILAILFVFQSMPSYWIGTMLVVIFYGLLVNPLSGSFFFPYGGVNTFGSGSSFLDTVWHMVLPTTALATPWIASYSRFVREGIIQELQQPYVLTARAKGRGTFDVIYKHILKNAAPLYLTLVAMDLPFLFAGAYYVEYIFSWPGIGSLFQDAAMKRDYPVVMGITLVVAILVVLGNFVVDVINSFINPRIRGI